MKEWMKYLLVIVGTYALVVLIRWMLKRDTETVEDIFLMSLAFAIPMGISNCFLFKMNKVIENTKNKNKNK